MSTDEFFAKLAAEAESSEIEYRKMLENYARENNLSETKKEKEDLLQSRNTDLDP